MYIKDKKSQPSGVKIVTLTGCLGYPKESVRMTTDTKPVANKEIFKSYKHLDCSLVEMACLVEMA
jgi:hypothetical protein